MKRASILILLLISFMLLLFSLIAAQEKRQAEHDRLVAERKQQIEAQKKLLSESVEKARQEVSANPDSAEAHFRLAEALAKNGMSSDFYKQIEEEYLKAIQLKPDYAEAYLGLALVQGRFSHFKDFPSKHQAQLETINKAILFKPDYAEAYNRLGAAHLGPVLGEERGFDTKKQAKLAAEAFGKATQLKSDLGEAYTGLGISNDYLEQYEGAVEAFKKAVFFNPNDDFSHYALGHLYIHFGQQREAMKEYEALIQIGDQMQVELEASGFPRDFNPAKDRAESLLEEIQIRFAGKKRPQYQVTNTNSR